MSAQSDRELLELAAKAVGIELRWHEPEIGKGEPWCYVPSAKAPHNRRSGDIMAGSIWNPLEDDGDAFRLAVKARLQIDIERDRACISVGDHSGRYGMQPIGIEGVEAATRMAIVRAVAAIATTKQEPQ